MKNRVNGLIHVSTPMRTLSRSALLRSAFLPFIPPAWPRLGMVPRIPQVAILSSGPYVSHDAAAADFELCYSVKTEVDTLSSTTTVTNYLFNGTPDEVDAFIAAQVDHTEFDRFDITWSHTPIGHYGQAAYQNPRTDYAGAFAQAKAIVESARPGRTYVTITDPNDPTQARDLPIPANAPDVSVPRLYPNLLAVNVGRASIRSTLFASAMIPSIPDYSGFAIRTYDDGSDGIYGRYLDASILSWEPPLFLSLWDSPLDAKAFLAGIIRDYGNPAPGTTPNDIFRARQIQYQPLGIDYQYPGSLSAVTGAQVAQIIADHFGFAL